MNTAFRKLLNVQGTEMRMCRDPEVKCAILERFNRTLKYKLYNWFTRKDTYRYVDVLDKLIAGYVCTRAGEWPYFLGPTRMFCIYGSG